ncbi:MAG: helix-turn-helix domain-containing protein [Nitrospinota bacterium]
MSTKSIRKIELTRTARDIDKKVVGKRIKSIRGGETLARFGQKIGVAHTTVRRYEQGMLPSPEILYAISRISGSSMSWLLTGVETESGEPPQPPPSLPEDEYVSVPLTEGKIAAGEPIITQENVIDWVVIHVRPLKKALSSARDLVACRVSGDSMWPVIADGDIIVIDRGADKKRILPKKIYAVWTDGGITAKMLQREGRSLFLLPLNPAEEIRKIDLRLNNAPVVGIVIGAWKDLL